MAKQIQRCGADARAARRRNKFNVVAPAPEPQGAKTLGCSRRRNEVSAPTLGQVGEFHTSNLNYPRGFYERNTN
jgi:hypothetical protein